MKKKALKIIAVIISAVMLMQACYLSTFAAFTVTLNETTAPRAAKYTAVNLLSGTHSLTAGRAGTVSFDDYTLEVKASFALPETDNGLFAPAEQSLCYGGNAQAFLENIANTPADSFGGWMMPVLSYVCEVVDGEDSGAVWYDRYGNAVVFDEVPIGEPEPGEAPSELEKIFATDNEAYDGFLLLKYSDAAMASVESSDDMYGVRYIILPQNHEESDINQVYHFDDNGRIMNAIDLTDSYVSSFTYVENGAFDAISSVTDLLGNEYRYTYTDGRATKIKCYNSDGDPVSLGTGADADPLEVTFDYENGKLSRVTYPDGAYTEYAYNADGMLTEAKNVDNSKIVLTYNENGYVTGMSKQFKDAQGVYHASNSVTVTVPALNQRRFVDETGYTVIKTFDDDGNILTVYDGDGNCLLDNTIVPEEPTTEPVGEPTTAPSEPATEPFEPVTEPFEPTTELWDFPEYRYGCDCCPGCQELNCACTCASEAECTCPQCKRYYEEITTDFGDIVNVVENISFDGVRSMTELNTYTEDGAYLTSSVDNAGNTVYYVYNTDSGLPESLSAGNSTVNFGYDAMGKLASLSQQVTGLTNGALMKNEYGYTDDRLTSITHNGFSYEFEYDTFGNQTKIKIGTLELEKYTYPADATEEAQPTRIEYANGQVIEYIYNEDGQIAAVSYDPTEGIRYVYSYDEDGALVSVTDTDAEQITVYTENGVEVRADDNEQTLLFSVAANEDGTVTRTAFDRAVTETDDSDYDPATGATTDTASYYREITDDDGPGYYAESRFETQKDWFGRVTEKEATVKSGMLGSNRYVEANNGTYSYTYYDEETTASPQVKSLAYSYSSQTYSRDYENFYEYDNKGNITGVYQFDGTEKVYSHKYYYDEANQLVREDFPGGDRTVVYAYDVGGNLRSRTWYQPTFGSLDNMEPTQVIEYGYGDGNWADRLTSYNGTSVDADEMGNITLFENTQLTWTAGRQLETTTYHGVTKRYYYNADGYIAKIVSTDASTGAQKEEIDYFWQDGKILALRQKDLRNDGDETIYEYLYDSDGELQAIESGAFRFMLEKNLLGDIIGVSLVNIAAPNQPLRLMDVDYDAYGEPELLGLREDPSIGFITIFYMAISPVLYRGYLAIPVGEHFCYYLGSRFYCPDLGRFLNADVYQDTAQGVVGTNMFAYCNNNPILNKDACGEESSPTNFSAIVPLMKKMLKMVLQIVYTVKTLMSPYKVVELQDGKTKKIISEKGAHHKFICSIAGVAYIHIKTTYYSNIKIVQINSYNKQSTILDTKDTEVKLYTHASISADNTYEIYIDSNAATEINCTVSQNCDSYRYSAGAAWDIDLSYGVKNQRMYYTKIWYLSKDKVSLLDSWLNQPNTIEAMEMVDSLYLDPISVILGMAGGDSLLYSFIYSVLGSFTVEELEYFCSQRTRILYEMQKIGKKDNSSSVPKYNQGIVFYVMYQEKELYDPSSGQSYTTGYYYHSISAWNGGVMYGEKGSKGNWTKNA